MPKKNLFSVLTQSPWWISLLIAVALFLGTRAFLPDMTAAASTLPFLVIAAIAAWRQLRAPSARKVEEVLGKLRAMSWDQFSSTLEEAFRRDGNTVTRLSGGGADFELNKGGRVALVSCKRWKVGHTGADPLRELYEARRKLEAHEGVYVSAGDFTDNALAFADEKGIRLLHNAPLAHLVAPVLRAAKRAARSRKPR
jgi:restriction system protein